MRTRIVNRHREPYDVYIGRGTPFGNEYRIGPDGTRSEVIAKHHEDFLHRIQADPKFRTLVLALKGKVLGCSCKPLACHGDTIVAWLEGPKDKKALF